jgi:hypothetical protein
MGFKADQIEVCEKPSLLEGFYSTDTPRNANVIIRKKNSGIPSDIGWEKGSDGSFIAYIDEYDYHRGVHYSPEWQKKLMTWYGVERSILECKRKGYQYTEDLDEKQRPRLRVNIN